MVVWPDNHQVWDVFDAMSTQWRIAVGMGGGAATGMDYSALPGVMKTMGIKKRDRRRVFDELREMERWALSALSAG